MGRQNSEYFKSPPVLAGLIGLNIIASPNFDLIIRYGYQFNSTTKFTATLNSVTTSYHFKNDYLQFGLAFRPLSGAETKQKTGDKISKQLIIELKSGVLLVCLPDTLSYIEKLKRIGKLTEADEIQKQVMLFYGDMIKAFKQNYTFGRVAFFYKKNIDQIKNYNYSNCFLNENLQVDNNIFFTEVKMMIADIKINEASLYGPSPTLLLENIVIKDAEYNRVSKPFPYDITLGGDFKNREQYLNSFVNKLNNELNRFYEKNK